MQQMVNDKVYNVGVYCRLSSDDGSTGDSASIQNQKDIITTFVKNKGWNVYNYYIDDGFSGTNFERPGFNRLINDIENGYVNAVITKDLSRLGRDYLKSGYYIDNYFPQHDVRYIAISDGVDTIDSLDDFIPFRNVINEMYAKDISKKIRFTLNNQIKNGIDTPKGIPLYGYMYVDGKRVVNPDTAPIVKRVFDLYLEGLIPSQIANKLEEDRVLTPKAYNYMKFGSGDGCPDYLTEGPFKWTARAINSIIDNEAYTGTLVRGLSQTRFKSKVKKIVPKDKRYYFENAFEAIIDDDTFELAREIRETYQKRYSAKTPNKYAGIAYCGICGKRLKHKVDVRANRRDFVRLTCRRKCGDNCGTILYEDLDKVVRSEIMELKRIVLKNKDEFIKKVGSIGKRVIKDDEYNLLESKRMKLEEDINKVDMFLKRTVSDYSSGSIPESTYHVFISDYTKQKELLSFDLKEVIELIEKKKTDAPVTEISASEIVERLEKLTPATCVTQANIAALITKIYVSTDGKRKSREKMDKNITIVYRHIDGFVKEFMKGK